MLFSLQEKQCANLFYNKYILIWHKRTMFNILWSNITEK